MNYQLINIDTRTAADRSIGELSVFDDRDIPFDIKRVYYICGVDAGRQRGYHAHRTLWQILFCPFGRIIIKMDDGSSIREVLLDKPDKALIIGPGVWHTMKWEKQSSVLCVAASDYYNESDYIRDYDEFLAYIKAKNASMCEVCASGC